MTLLRHWRASLLDSQGFLCSPGPNVLETHPWWLNVGPTLVEKNKQEAGT